VKVTWSFSSIKLFEQCPRKYHHLKVLKDYKEPDSEATLYGTEFHRAAENYIKDGTALPPFFGFAKPALDNLKQLKGEKLCEYRMALTEDLEPCDFFDDRVWFRGVADLIVLDHEAGEARCIDYKTGKSAKYADAGQLELMALCLFKHFPTIKKVKSGLLFVVCNAFVKDKHSADQQEVLWEGWIQRHNRLKIAMQNDVWNPKPSGLCKKHCIVTSCSHNGRS